MRNDDENLSRLYAFIGRKMLHIPTSDVVFISIIFELYFT